jgi:hypothetical protein
MLLQARGHDIQPGASDFPSFSSSPVAGSGDSCSRFLWPLTWFSDVCLSGLRVRTVIVSRVTREERSVLRSSVEPELVCLRDEVEGFLSIAEELVRCFKFADIF